LFLAANEYPVSWLDPVAAAWLGVTIEIGGAVLLGFGLGTRMAAFAMFCLALVIQFNYLPFDTHLFWAALLGFYGVHGAGPLSLDRLLARGLVESALPFGATFLRAARSITSWLSCTVLSSCCVHGLRRRMLAAAGADIARVMPAQLFAKIFPLQTAQHLPLALAIGGAWLLAAGLGTRVTSLILLVAVVACRRWIRICRRTGTGC
jgi:NADH dehydrogenase/putative oxidoreductase